MKLKEVKKLFSILILGIFCLGFITALIEIGVVKQDDCIELYQSCPTCTYSDVRAIKYPNGTIDNSMDWEMAKDNSDYTYEFCLTNTTGEYFYTVYGNKGGLGYESTEEGTFEVTPTGFLPNITRGIMNIGLLSFLVLFFIFSLIGLFKVENYKGKFALYWVCHILIVAITFIAWHMAKENLMTENATAGIFKVFFYVSTIAVFPMLILSIVWIVYIHLFNEHFQKLIDKGEDPETAFRLTNKKRGGWFHGK